MAGRAGGPWMPAGSGREAAAFHRPKRPLAGTASGRAPGWKAASGTMDAPDRIPPSCWGSRRGQEGRATDVRV